MRSLAAVLSLALVASAATVGVVTSAVNTTVAAQAVAGVPASPTVVYTENFENRTAGSTQLLTSYASVTGQTYTADASWASALNCNGFVLDRTSSMTDPTWCGSDAASFTNLTAVPNAIGILNGQSAYNTNAALAAYTAGDPGANLVEFKTATPITLSEANKFVTFSVDSGAMNCSARPGILAHPQYFFYLIDATDVSHQLNATALDPCVQGTSVTSHMNSGAAATVKVASLVANDAGTLVNGDSFDIVLKNANGSGWGNDAAIDNIRVLDVTPQLEEAFSPASVATGGTSTLTYTVTNTSELSKKDGWSFTNTLPTGLTATGVTGGTCSATTSASGSTVAVSSGSLASSETSCTITVEVTASPTVTTTYTSTASKISDLVGMNNITAPASVTFVANPKLQITKTATGAVDTDNLPVALADVGPGDTITYTVTGTNIGDGDGTTDNPAILTDDVTGVLDDANYDGNARATSPSGSGTIVESLPKITWSGPLLIGQKVTETYSVTLKNSVSSGDRKVVNTAYDGDGTTPSPCAAETPTCATVEVDLPALTVAKSASVASIPADGSTVTYTVTVTNPGPGNWTSRNLATMTDDLSGVLDDATYNSDVSASSGTTTVSGNNLSWSGALAAGASATVTYSVTYHANQGGDRVLTNTASVPERATPPATPSTVTVTVPGGAYTISKSVSPSSGSGVEADDTLTYTVTYTSTGVAAAAVDTTDDLSGILDDATLIGGPTPSNGNLVASLTGSTLSVTGDLPVGATYTVSYAVKVKAFASQANHDLTSVVFSNNGGQCATQCSTDNPVKHVTVSKTATASTTPTYAGDTVTYTMTVTNNSTYAYTALAPALVTDDLSGVLNRASYNGDVSASAGSATVSGTALSWSGPLAVGASVTVTYSVKVTDMSGSNLTTVASWSDCATDDTTCVGATTTPLAAGLPPKTVDPVSDPQQVQGLAETSATSGNPAVLLAGGIALVGGILLFGVAAVRRRKERR